MKAVTNIIGILLILFGIIAFAYQGVVTYSTKDKVVDIGNLKVMSERQNTIYIPPIASGVSIVVGIALIALARMSKK